MAAAREQFERDWSELPEKYSHLTNPTRYEVGVSPGLKAFSDSSFALG